MDRYFKLRLERHLKNAIRYYENLLSSPEELLVDIDSVRDALDEAKTTLIQLQTVEVK